MSQGVIGEIERLIRRDPARRGLVSSESLHGPLCPGHLAPAAEHLARNARSVGIVTGFFIPRGEPPAAETDGPAGGCVLALSLRTLGIESFLITDAHCQRAVSAAAEASGLPPEAVHCPGSGPRWIDEFFAHKAGRNLTHLIALERVGPAHTPESLIAQSRAGSPPLEEFLQSVSPDDYDRCHNMRGELIDDWTAGLHRLFEELPTFRPEAISIGIGDGGNEIGMGTIPWEELVRRLDGEHTRRIPCRIATDWTILAGVSNWGGFALAAALLYLRGRTDLLVGWTPAWHQVVLEHTIARGPAVDGVTRRAEPTVDGLPFLTYIQPWEGMRRLLHSERASIS